jgi:hypothetical protein
MKSTIFYEYNGPFYSKGIFKVCSDHIHLTVTHNRSIFATLENYWRLAFTANKKERIYE